jgi:hypothetical protein
MAEEFRVKEKSEIVSRLTGIIWGPPKAGKTSLLMTSPGKKLLVNVDPDGYTSISGRDDWSLLDLAQYTHAEIVALGTKKVPTMIQKMCDEGKLVPGDTVIGDSLSSFGDAALLTAIQNKVGEGKGFTPSIEAPGLSAYGARTQYILEFVRQLLKVTARNGLNCWFTAHMDTPVTDDKNNYLYQSMTLSDKATSSVGLSISEIWFIDSNDRKRTIAVRPVRGRKPMGSRIFTQSGDAEFILKFDIDKPDTQPHSISTWWKAWEAGGKKKLELPT